MIPRSGRSPGKKNANLLQYFGLENSPAGYSPWGCKEWETTERLIVSRRPAFPLRIILGSTSISASGAMDTHRDQAVVNQPKQLSATSAGGGQTLRRCPGTLASGYSPFCEIPSPCVWTGPGANFELTQTMRKPVGCHCHDQAIKDGTSVHASSACRLG